MSQLITQFKIFYRKFPQYFGILRNFSGALVAMHLMIPVVNPIHLAYNATGLVTNYAQAKTISASDFPNTFPVSEPNEPRKTMKIAVTAYNSLPGQTDSTPCITANGFNLCKHDTEDQIAANFLPFGTKVKFPEIYGDRVFTVSDRMNKRYWYHTDIWMKSYSDASKFGLKYTTIEIY